MTTLLALTADQQTQAASIFTQAASAEATAHDALKTAEQNLHTATKTGNGNIDQLAATVGALTGQIAAIRAKADAAFYQILTADQQSKLTQFEADGPGGPRPPGGGPMDHPPMMGDR
jgi:Spy/CpxP family protein refolding chaperone